MFPPRELTSQAGAIDKLVQLLTHDLPGIQLIAVALLGNALMFHPPAAPAAAAAGAVAPLVALLAADAPPEHQRCAAGALESLADHAPASRPEIVAAGGVARLVALLAVGDALARCRAAGALWGLAGCEGGGEARAAVRAAGGIGALADVLAAAVTAGGGGWDAAGLQRALGALGMVVEDGEASR